MVSCRYITSSADYVSGSKLHHHAVKDAYDVLFRCTLHYPVSFVRVFVFSMCTFKPVPEVCVSEVMRAEADKVLSRAVVN